MHKACTLTLDKGHRLRHVRLAAADDDRPGPRHPAKIGHALGNGREVGVGFDGLKGDNGQVALRAQIADLLLPVCPGCTARNRAYPRWPIPARARTGCSLKRPAGCRCAPSAAACWRLPGWPRRRRFSSRAAGTFPGYRERVGPPIQVVVAGQLDDIRPDGFQQFNIFGAAAKAHIGPLGTGFGAVLVKGHFVADMGQVAAVIASRQYPGPGK